ncbi:hypothetical protein [Nitrosomonas sp. Is37]|uniref:hypothetical protein n=1 Tax=Nitrosomonas sp. Is37 TaxID=3080535 RepID=UPI00294AC80C|nr:hypothetical protein [Nitrosomonas sp. Is37]MDV6345637.1 hypothetical protein [Nitrosomonas sp. Is37]
MAAVINVSAELREISAYLSKAGVPETDHHIILNKLTTDTDAHLRYLNQARQSNGQSTH